uniref:Uncharacterized protein n=1 Tax=Arundo donax TaxID=35708 RepID=A0A0A9CPT1_ARUDO
MIQLKNASENSFLVCLQSIIHMSGISNLACLYFCSIIVTESSMVFLRLQVLVRCLLIHMLGLKMAP